MDPTTFRMIRTADSSSPPVEITFQSSNYNPNGHGTSTLSWTVLHSASQSIDQGIGSVAATGSTVVGPYNNTTIVYTLTAIGLDGLTYTQSITIVWKNCIYPAHWGMC